MFVSHVFDIVGRVEAILLADLTTAHARRRVETGVTTERLLVHHNQAALHASVVNTHAVTRQVHIAGEAEVAQDTLTAAVHLPSTGWFGHRSFSWWLDTGHIPWVWYRAAFSLSGWF